MKESDIFERAFRPFWACSREGSPWERPEADKEVVSVTSAVPGKMPVSPGGCEVHRTTEEGVCGTAAGRRPDRHALSGHEICERQACGGSGRSCRLRVRGV